MEQSFGYYKPGWKSLCTHLLDRESCMRHERLTYDDSTESYGGFRRIQEVSRIINFLNPESCLQLAIPPFNHHQTKTLQQAESPSS